MAKLSKQEAEYEYHPRAGCRCADCTMLVKSRTMNDRGTCTAVEGTIYLNGYCKLWDFDPKSVLS